MAKRGLPSCARIFIERQRGLSPLFSLSRTHADASVLFLPPPLFFSVRCSCRHRRPRRRPCAHFPRFGHAKGWQQVLPPREFFKSCTCAHARAFSLSATAPFTSAPHPPHSHHVVAPLRPPRHSPTCALPRFFFSSVRVRRPAQLGSPYRYAVRFREEL